MRKHLKYLRKEKGLTLVELLAVLVILGIVAAIAVPMIGNIIQDSKDKATVNEALNIISAAKLADTNGETPTSDNTYSVADLKSNGYLDIDGYADVSAVKESNGWVITYTATEDGSIIKAVRNLVDDPDYLSDAGSKITEKQLLLALEKEKDSN